MTKIAQAVELTIVTENVPPFQMVDKNDDISGFATELLKKALATTSISYHIQFYPWFRAYNMAEKRKNTCIYSIVRTKQREHLFQWTTEFFSTNSYFWGLKSSKHIRIKSLQDAKKYMTAVVKNDVTNQFLIDHNFTEMKNYYVVDNSNALLKLLYLRSDVDLILVDKLSFAYRARENNLDVNLFKPYLKLNKHPLPFYVACSLTTDPTIVSTISNALKRLKKSDEQQKIKQRWFGTPK